MGSRKRTTEQVPKQGGRISISIRHSLQIIWNANTMSCLKTSDTSLWLKHIKSWFSPICCHFAGHPSHFGQTQVRRPLVKLRGSGYADVQKLRIPKPLVFALVITNVYWILLDDFEVPPIQETFMFHLVDVLLEKILAFPSLTQSASKSYNSWWPTSIKCCTNPKAAMFFFRSKTRSRDINKTQTSTCRFHTTHGYVKSQDFPNISKPNDPILPSSLKRHLPHLDMRNHGSWER